MEKQENNYDKTFYLTTLNVLSCFSVIMLHCNTIYWQAPVGKVWIRIWPLNKFGKVS